MAIPNFDNGARDLVTVSDVANSSGDTTTTRLGDTIPTLQGALRVVAASSAYTVDTLPKLTAITPPAGMKPAGRVTEGVDAGYYIWNDTAWELTTDAIGSSITTNRGKPFPLRIMTRRAITSPAGNNWNNIVLKIKVTGAEKYFLGKYFRLGYFQNGAPLGDNDNGVTLEEFDAAAYETSDATMVEIHNHADSPATYDRDKGGIQTFVVIPKLRPYLRFEITVDVDALPPKGTAVNASYLDTAPAWSWIIDPSCYEPEIAAGFDSTTLNAGKRYPFKSANRAGVVSPENTAFTSSINDFKVLGAESNTVYRPAYYVNGDPGLPGAPEGWILEKCDAALYGTTAPMVVIHALTDPAPTIDRSIVGPQVITISCAKAPGTVIQITVDAANLPPRGTSIRSNTAGQVEGRSWIIDQHCYFQTPSPASSKQHLYYKRTGNTVLTAWRDTDCLMRVDFGPNGFNGLPNIMGAWRSTGSNIEAATWIAINSSTTDWISPTLFRATVDFESGAIPRFTGGNHDSEGNGTGVATARNVLYQLFADGEPIKDGDSGYCGCITATCADELFAYNTISLGRYCLEQAYRVDIFPGAAQVTMQKTNLDSGAIVMERDYSIQMVATGFNATALILDGQYTTKQPYSSTIASGNSATYPNSWAVILESSIGKQMAWLDRAYSEASSGTMFDSTSGNPTASNVFFSSSKTYVMSFWKDNGGTALTLAPGESYRWRGGYAWSGNVTLNAAYMASAQLRKEGQLNTLAVRTPQLYSLN